MRVSQESQQVTSTEGITEVMYDPLTPVLSPVNSINSQGAGSSLIRELDVSSPDTISTPSNIDPREMLNAFVNSDNTVMNTSNILTNVATIVHDEINPIQNACAVGEPPEGITACQVPGLDGVLWLTKVGEQIVNSDDEIERENVENVDQIQSSLSLIHI